MDDLATELEKNEDPQAAAMRRSLARVGARLESALKLLSTLSSLSSIPVRVDGLETGAVEILKTLVRELEGVEGCSLLLYYPDEDLLRLVAASGQDEFWGGVPEDVNKDLAFKPGEGLAGRAFAENLPYFWSRSTSLPELMKTFPGLRSPISLACLPQAASDNAGGVLNISFCEDRPFDHVRQRDLILMSEVVFNIVRDFLLKAEKKETSLALEKKVADLERETANRRRIEEEIKILAKFPDENPNPILRVHEDLSIRYANPASAILTRKWRRKAGKFLPESWKEPIERCLKLGTISGYEIEVGDRYYSFMLVPVSETRSVYIFGRDITERKVQEEQLLLMASVFENTIEGIVITDAEGKIETVNQAFSLITGYTASEVRGQNPRILKSGRHEPPFYKEMWDSLIANGKWRGQVWNRRKNGEAYPEWLSINAIPDAHGNTARYVAVFHDITDIKSKEAEMKHQAEHDPLTGLPNRALFNDRLAMTLARAQRNQEMVALLFLDLDDFKHINDSLGHAVGDLLLKEVARRLTACLRQEDTVARLGGDEFIIILPQVAGRSEGAQAASRVIETLAAPIRIGENELHIGVSIGITLYPLDGGDSGTLVKNADMAMYRAKERGKNNFQVYSSAMNADAVKRLDMDRRLRKALERDEFVLHYQPRVELGAGEIVGMEALLRWEHPEKGLLPPDEFIPWAEETGLFEPVGRWALVNACRQAQAWRAAGLPPIRLSVNVSPRHFLAKGLIHTVEKALLETGFDPASLELEVTETAVAKDVEAAVEIMNQLHEMGIRLSIDDFGTGYSSLIHLKKLPIHTLKIDRSFIRDIPHHADDMAIATAIVYLARSMHLKVAAEGVETPEQVRFLQNLGCDEIQGFVFRPALPGPEFEPLLQRGERFAIPSGARIISLQDAVTED